MDNAKKDGLSSLDSKSRELVATAASAIQKVDWTYDRSPDPEILREGFKHMRAAIYALDAVVTHGGNVRAEYAIDAVDAVKQHTLRTEAASAIWQHHAPKMASETKEYYRPDWFYPERLHNHSWDMGKIAAMGHEHGIKIEGNPKMAEPKEVVKARRQVREKQNQYWQDLASVGRTARVSQGQSAGQAIGDGEESRRAARQKTSAAAGMAGLALAAIAAPASAQDIGFLERMSQERNAAMHSPQQTPSPAGPSAQLAQPSQHLTCMSTTPWQPVLAQPSAEAPALGKTQPQVAATGRTVNGYAQITYYNGQTGYVPAPQVHPFQSTVKPGGTCSVAGVRQNGAPVFRMG